MASAKPVSGHVVTGAHQRFCDTGQVDKNQHLFCVNAGVDIEDALESASCNLQMTFEIIQSAAMSAARDDNGPLYGSNAFLVLSALEGVHAVIEAVREGLDEANQAKLR
ncbi:DUF3077 domain-containing protein [Pseudomonas oryzihabitans]|uniref:DUF3077 domain-containing protein n=1 Tax=Pseudomonas oryzihabitans TaxID=47885 RepID=UPI00241FCC44|nr:DUF3077 domain-containing protein [Pseudomonas oryzihabitans]